MKYLLGGKKSTVRVDRNTHGQTESPRVVPSGQRGLL